MNTMTAPTERGVLASLKAMLADVRYATRIDTKQLGAQRRREAEEAYNAVAGLIEERDALRGALNRIVTYYDLRKHSGRLPTMDSQAECEHELTMFGEARKVLAQTERMS